MSRQHRTVWRALLAFATLLIVSTVVQADEEADHNALRKLRATYEDALNNNDMTKLKPALADGFSGVMISGDEIKSFEDLQAFWKRVWEMIGAGGSYHVNVVTDQTDFFGDVGVSRGYNEEVFHTAAGKEYVVRPKWTAVTRRQNGEWKIFRVHAALNPIDNVAITEKVYRAGQIFGFSGVAAGLILGLLVGALWGKKRAARPAAA